MFGLNFINKLRPGKFKYTKELNSNNKINFGLKAQDINDVVDFDEYDIVKTTKLNGKEYYIVDYIQFIAPLIKSVQELSEKIRVLEEKQNANS